MKKILIVFLSLSLNIFGATASSSSSSEDVTTEDAPPVLSYNPEALAKPNEMTSLQWLEALEIERNKADYLGQFQAFKALTKEISATIGGKYGIFIPTTQDELITLSYSIIRTRHKFCGKRNMLSDFYSVKTMTADPQTQQYLAMVLAIDAMAFKAIDEEEDTFFDSWSGVNAAEPATETFVTAVKGCVQKQGKEPLATALAEPLTAFLTTNSATIALAKEVFDIFAPKITLKKIYSELMVGGGEYRGWTVHGVDAFAYPISLDSEDRKRFPGLEARYTKVFIDGITAEKKERDLTGLPCYSSTATYVTSKILAQFSIPLNSIFFEYVHNLPIGTLFKGTICSDLNMQDTPSRHLLLTKACNPTLDRILKIPFCRIPETLNERIDHASMKIMKTAYTQGNGKIDINDKDFLFLIGSGYKTAMGAYSYKLVQQLMMGNLEQFSKDIAEDKEPRAIELVRDAADLGCKDSRMGLPAALGFYAAQIFSRGCIDGMVHSRRNAERAIKFFKEAIALSRENSVQDAIYNGAEQESVRYLPIALKDYSLWLYKGENGITKDIPRAVEVCRESVALGNQEAKGFFPILLNNYAAWLFRGENGLEQNLAKAVDICREAANLGHEKTRLKLPVYLYTYASALFEGKANVPQDIPHAIKVCQEAADLGNEDAISNLPKMIATAQAQGLI